MEFGKEARKKLMDSLCSTCAHGPAEDQHRVRIPICDINRSNDALIGDCNDYLAFNEEAHCIMMDHRIINANQHVGPEKTAKNFLSL
jgi:hypothetical protein